MKNKTKEINDRVVTVYTNKSKESKYRRYDCIIDNDEGLIASFGNRRITYDKYKDVEGNGGYFKLAKQSHEKSATRLHRAIYEYYHGKKIKEGYVVDHLNSKTWDNRIHNLVQMPKKLHDYKLKLIDEIYMPYALHIFSNITEGDESYVLNIVDLGFRKSTVNNKVIINRTSGYHICAYIEYSNVEDLIMDLDILKEHSSMGCNPMKVKHIEWVVDNIRNSHEEDSSSPDIMHYKVREIINNNRGSRTIKYRYTDSRMQELWSVYSIHNQVTGGRSKGNFTENDFVIDTEVFNKSEDELSKRGICTISLEGVH